MDFEQDIKSCLEVINRGGTILYPTDTVWGIGCDALNGDAIEKVYNLKQRPKGKSCIVLLADARDILQYVAAPPPDIIAIVEQFSQPTTVVFDGALGFPDNLAGDDGSIAIRIPDDPFCKALIKRMKKPLVSTSANISGKPSPQTFDQVEAEIIQGVDYAVQFRRADTTIRPPSRVVRINENGDLEILRP